MPGFEWFDEEEKKEVQDVLETGILFRYGFDQARNGHWKAREFEEELCRKTGAAYSHLCSSGTAALSIALSACGVGAGDEVIVPPFTFVATVEAVLNAGAVPVFSEIDTTLCLDPDKLENALTSRTKAVLPVHMCGSMARIDEIEMFCRRKGLVLIEDACQALGGTYEQKALGTFGQMGCFSFDFVKTVTCGEGGAVITDDDSLYELSHEYADHGHDHIGSDRGLEGHPILGVNYRISELNAAVGLAQLKKLDLIIERQRRNKSELEKTFSEHSGVTLRSIPDKQGDSASFLSFIMADEIRARKLHKALTDEGVDGCFYWFNNNWHYLRRWEHLKNLRSSGKLPVQLLDNCPDYNSVSLPVSDDIMSRTISMLIKLSWTEKDVADRIERIGEAFKKI